MTNLWRHAPDDEEYPMHLAWAVEAVKDCKIVVLLGSEATMAFLDEKVSDVSGLWVKSKILPDKKIISAPNPAAVLRGTLGEFRLAMEGLGDGYKRTRRKAV